MPTTLEPKRESVRTVIQTESCRADIYFDWDFPKDVVEAWNVLARRYGGPGIFLSHCWFTDFQRAFGENRRPCVIVLRSNDAPIGIIPLWYDEAAGLRHSLASLTNDHTCYYDALIGPDYLPQAGRCLSDVLSRFDLAVPLRLEYMPAGGALAALLNSGDSWPMPTCAYSGEWAPAIRVAGRTFADYEAALSSKLRSNLRRYRRRAEEDGPLVFSVTQTTAGLDALLTEAFKVEASGWKGAEGTAISAHSDTDRFYRSVAHTAALSSSLYLFVLRHNGKMVAFSLCIAADGVLFQLKTGYDELRCARFAGGSLLHHELIRYVFRAGVFHTYNLLGACAPWKAEWQGVPEQFQWASVYPATVRGRLRYAMEHGWKEQFKRSETAVRIAGAFRRHIPQ